MHLYRYKSQLESILADSQAAAAVPSVGWEIDLQSPGRTKVPRLTPASVLVCARRTYLRSGKKPDILRILCVIELHTLGCATGTLSYIKSQHVQGNIMQSVRHGGTGAQPASTATGVLPLFPPDFK